MAASGVIFNETEKDKLDGLILSTDGCPCHPVPTNDGRWMLVESVCDDNEAQFLAAGFIKAINTIVPDLQPYMTSGA